MHRQSGFPLDYREGDYPYLERPNPVLVRLVQQRVLDQSESCRILDVGCGAGANARRLRELCPEATLVGIEPNGRAAALARATFDELFEGSVERWLCCPGTDAFAAVILSDVLEHVVDPVGLLRNLAGAECLRAALWFVSVPNYAVWYNRLRTVAGRFDYTWSGLYDRTHLRFFTRTSLRRTLEHCGFYLLDELCSPSLAQSAAPVLRRYFEQALKAGHHLALNDSAAYRAYQRFVEPAETRICGLWPELLGFQLVAVARLSPRAAPGPVVAASEPTL
jgi:SAM-dependent methyltransferase